jgi:hypothetical protein
MDFAARDQQHKEVLTRSYRLLATCWLHLNERKSFLLIADDKHLEIGSEFAPACCARANNLPPMMYA